MSINLFSKEQLFKNTVEIISDLPCVIIVMFIGPYLFKPLFTDITLVDRFILSYMICAIILKLGQIIVCVIGALLNTIFYVYKIRGE